MTIYTPEVSARAHTCLSIAFEVCKIFERRVEKLEPGQVLSIEFSEILTALKPFFPYPLAPTRRHYIGLAIAHELTGEDSLTTCTVWNMAHLFEHALYEENIDDLVR